ncbi:MAG: DUF4276 family protein [Gemmataceae bacterium]
MTRVHIVVEGQSEEAFVNNVLAPAVVPRRVYLHPILLGDPDHKGGNTSYARVQKDVLRLLKGDSTAFCSTMLDFYGLGKGFPGTPPPPNLSNLDKITHIEQAVKQDIIRQAPNLRPDVRFLPYLQLHEYEGLLFSDPAALARGISQPNLAGQLQSIREDFPTPEDIDDSPNNAPSKRILRICSSYRKVLNGTQAAAAVGIDTMRRECAHFRNWLDRLEQLAD